MAPLITDESLDTRLAGSLRRRGRDSASIASMGLKGLEDPDLVRAIIEEYPKAVLVTADDHMPEHHPADLTGTGITVATIDPQRPAHLAEKQWHWETVHRWAHRMAEQPRGTWYRYGELIGPWRPRPRHDRTGPPRTCRGPTPRPGRATAGSGRWSAGGRPGRPSTPPPSRPPTPPRSAARRGWRGHGPRGSRRSGRRAGRRAAPRKGCGPPRAVGGEGHVVEAERPGGEADPVLVAELGHAEAGLASRHRLEHRPEEAVAHLGRLQPTVLLGGERRRDRGDVAGVPGGGLRGQWCGGGRGRGCRRRRWCRCRWRGCGRGCRWRRWGRRHAAERSLPPARLAPVPRLHHHVQHRRGQRPADPDQAELDAEEVDLRVGPVVQP